MIASYLIQKKIGLRRCCLVVFIFFSISGGSVSLGYRLVRYNVWKTSVSFRYQLWRLYDVLSWSVSLRYQLVHRYNVSNRSVWTTYQWGVTKTSQIGPSHSRTSRDVVVMTSQLGPRRLDLHETVSSLEAVEPHP